MNINEKKSFDVIVIGGGAAGKMAGLTAIPVLKGAGRKVGSHPSRIQRGGHDDLRA